MIYNFGNIFFKIIVTFKLYYESFSRKKGGKYLLILIGNLGVEWTEIQVIAISFILGKLRYCLGPVEFDFSRIHHKITSKVKLSSFN